MPCRFTEATRQGILKAYLHGTPVAVIAATFGCDPSYPGLLANRRGAGGCRWTDQHRRNMAESARVRMGNTSTAAPPPRRPITLPTIRGL